MYGIIGFKTKHVGPILCEFNQYVECSGPKMCGKCGWNPEVEKVRKAKFVSEEVQK